MAGLLLCGNSDDVRLGLRGDEYEDEDVDGDEVLVRLLLLLLDRLSAYEERLSAYEERLSERETGRARPMPKARYASAVQWELDLWWEV